MWESSADRSWSHKPEWGNYGSKAYREDLRSLRHCSRSQVAEEEPAKENVVISRELGGENGVWHPKRKGFKEAEMIYCIKFHGCRLWRLITVIFAEFYLITPWIGLLSISKLKVPWGQWACIWHAAQFSICRNCATATLFEPSFPPSMFFRLLPIGLTSPRGLHCKTLVSVFRKQVHPWHLFQLHLLPLPIHTHTLNCIISYSGGFTRSVLLFFCLAEA